MKLPVITLEKNTLQDLEKSKKLEWLLTNGLGGYASSTVIGMNTRKYHGLLVTSERSPLERKVVLSKLEEEIVLKDKIVNLSTNRYLNAVYPEGYRNLVKFELNPFPNFFYEVEGLKIQKTIFMCNGKNIVIVKYKIDNPKNITFTLRVHLLINYRSIYSLTKSPISFKVEKRKKNVKILFPDDNFLILSGCEFKESLLSENERWYKNFFYEVDAQRGEECTENNYNPGCFEKKVKGEKTLYLAFGYSVQEKELKNPEKTISLEIERKKRLLEKFFERNRKVPADEWIKWLVLAADSHIITRFDKKKSMIAGYHWFGEWGRDTLISLPGLCLSTGRLSDAIGMLKTYSLACKNGLIPNVLPTNSEKISYKSVDTSLLFIDRVYRVYRHVRNVRFVEEFWPVMKGIIENYINGTLHGIRMDSDGLISHEAGLTWMDVFLDGEYVTPREGKAVEIQALWYDALKIMEFFARKLNENWKKYSILSRKVKESFNEKFWNGSYLDDCLGDSTLRPNQIFAVDLSFSMLDEEKKKKVLSVMKKELMIKYGLRTLSKNDPRFHGKYSGSRKERDLSYHQGTAWPWLLGMFVRSWARVKKDKKIIEKIVKPFVEEEIMRLGLGTISEIVDGDPPFESRGCISQAWSIGEILDSVTRVYSL